MSNGEQLPSEVYELLAAGRKIEAIKLIRRETALSLAEARELAEVLSGNTKPAAPPPAMTEEGGAGGMVAIIIALLIAFLLYVSFLSD